MQATRMIKRALDTAEQVGAVAGGFLPGASLAQYLTHDLPSYYRTVRDAPEVPWQDLNKVLRPGDIGLGGMYAQSDPLTAYLNYGSQQMSGGPGTHGQVVGPRIRRFVNPRTGTVRSGTTTAAQAAAQRLQPRNLLSLFHGGQHQAVNIWGAQRRYPSAFMAALLSPKSKALRAGKNSLPSRVTNFFRGLREVPSKYRDLLKEDEAATALAFKSRGKKFLLDRADTVTGDAQYFADKMQRPYIYMRDKAGPIRMSSPQGKAFKQLLLREAVAPYDVAGASGAGLKSLLMPRFAAPLGGVPTLKQELAAAKGNVAEAVKRIYCDASGHHCGSMPMAIAQRLNLAPRSLSARFTLPSQLLLNKQLTPVAVVNKAKMLSGLRNAAIGRTALGLGATAAGAFGGASLAGRLTGMPDTIRSHVQAMIKRKFGL